MKIKKDRLFKVTIVAVISFVIIAAGLFFGRPVYAATNLIANPSLEIDADNNGLPDGWFTGSWGTNDAAFSYPVAGSNGVAAAKVVINNYTSGDAKWYFQDIAVTAGQIYDFQDSYQASVDTSLVARYYNANGNFSYGYLANVPAATNWRTASVGITPPAGTVSLTVFHLLSSVGSLTVDNFSFTEFIPPSPPPVDQTNLIANPSLEVDADNNKIPDQWLSGSWGSNNASFKYPVASLDGARAAQINITSFTGGDAKWYFRDVAVTPGQRYHFQDSYLATAATQAVIRYTSTAQAISYVSLGFLPAAASWQTAAFDFNVPAGISTLTIFHLLAGVGSLTVDAYRLEVNNTSDPSLFDKGFVSLTFDDGWKSQSSKAKPILDAAGLKSTFYIITQEILDAAPKNLIVNPSLEIDIDNNKIPDGWATNRSGLNIGKFTYPVAGINGGVAARTDITTYLKGDAKWYFNKVAVDANQPYSFHDQYLSNAASIVSAVIKLANGKTQTMTLTTLKAAASWTPLNLIFTTPANAVSLTIYHALTAKGYLTVDDYNLNLQDISLYMSPVDLLNLQASGYEIGSHTQTHLDLTTSNAAQAQAEIIGSKNDLLNLGVTSVSSLAYPDGYYNNSIEQLVSNASYTSARTVDYGYNGKTTNKFALVTQVVEASTTLAQVKAWIDQSTVSKTWLILVFHQIDETGQPYGTTSSVLKGIVDYLQSLNVPVKTVTQGVALMQ